ncbi:MAG: enoyl-CoA hydratase-related protein [Actinomycetota bacterium]|nr:enoyl-CoA hydratase-related protein [Actinomycetota bacterium]
MIDFEIRERVAVLTIRRVEARNTVDGAVAEGIERAVDRIEADAEIRAGVLAAEGSVFCAGADLDAIIAGQADTLSTARGGFGGLVWRDRGTPLIAAVDGPALSGGLELALACDLIVASRHAVFGLPEVKRSLVATGGALFRLPQVVGTNVAREMILTGDPITAERAYHLGLVNRLVEPGDALDGALDIARRIVANAPLAVRESRSVSSAAFGQAEAELWSRTAGAAQRVARTEDFAEGPRAFVDQRPPVWHAR